MRIETCLPALLAALLLAGCASERVVLLPSRDGHPGKLLVRDAGGQQQLDRPYAGTVRRLGSNARYQATPDEVDERFGAALAAQPRRPISYMLYFKPGGNVLTPESQAELHRLQAEMAERAAPEMMVIGHTDSVGGTQGNDTLSLQRAVSVRGWLIEGGVVAGKIEAVGRGERELLVPTGDEVDEPRNRRVEINLR